MNDVLENIDLSTVLVRRGDLIAQELEGELVMLDMRSGHYFGLDPIASAIWSRLDKPITLQALCDSLTADYAVPFEQCLSDVSSFLDELLEKDLVERL